MQRTAASAVAARPRAAAAAVGAARGGDACMLFFPRNPYVLMCDRVKVAMHGSLPAAAAAARAAPRSLKTANSTDL